MNKHVSMKKKVLSFFLAFVILFSSMPAELFTFAFANDGTETTTQPAVSVKLSATPEEVAAGDSTAFKIAVDLTAITSADVKITLTEDEQALFDDEALKNLKEKNDSFKLTAKDGATDEYELSFTATETKDYTVTLKSPFEASASDEENDEPKDTTAEEKSGADENTAEKARTLDITDSDIAVENCVLAETEPPVDDEQNGEDPSVEETPSGAEGEKDPAGSQDPGASTTPSDSDTTVDTTEPTTPQEPTTPDNTVTETPTTPTEPSTESTPTEEPATPVETTEDTPTPLFAEAALAATTTSDDQGVKIEKDGVTIIFQAPVVEENPDEEEDDNQKPDEEGSEDKDPSVDDEKDEDKKPEETDPDAGANDDDENLNPVTIAAENLTYSVAFNDAEDLKPVDRKLPAFSVTATAELGENAELSAGGGTFTFDLQLQLPAGTTLPSGSLSADDDSIESRILFFFARSTIMNANLPAGATLGEEISYDAENSILTIPITQNVDVKEVTPEPEQPADTDNNGEGSVENGGTAGDGSVDNNDENSGENNTTPTARTTETTYEPTATSWTYTLKFNADVFTLADTVGESAITASIVPAGATDGAAATGSINIAKETAQLPEDTKPTETTTLDQTILWYDNNNADNARPDKNDFKNTPLYFKVGSGAWEQLTYANLTDAGLEDMPEIAVTNSSQGGYQLSVENLPTELQKTDDNGTVLNTTTIDWSFSENGDASKAEPPAMDGYEATVNAEGQWVYTRLTEIVFTVELDWGSLGDDNQKLRDDAANKVLSNFVLNGENSSTPLINLFEDGLLKMEITEGTNSDEPTTFTFTLKDQPMYDAENHSALINYNVSASKNIINGEEIQLTLPGYLTGEDAGDYLVATYDNTHAVNHSKDTDAVYPGGTLNLRLTGETTFEASKVWLDYETWDKEEVNRPALTFELWRYREDSTYSQAAPVKNDSGNVIKINLSKEESEKYEPEEKIPLQVLGADGNLAALEKYDADGYRYIYFLKETVVSGGDTYDRVFGKVERELGQGDVTITDDALPTEHAEIYAGRTERLSDDNCLYNKGVLSNQLAGTQTVELTKEWNAAAYQGYMKDVSVEFTLQVQYLNNDQDKDKWYTAYPEQKVTQKNITEENMAYWHTSATVPTVGPLGRDVAYRWVETAVYQNKKDVTTNRDEFGAVKSFTLEQGGKKVTYTSEATVDKDTGNTTIENSIADTINYDVTKIWKDRTNPDEVTFNLYRMPSGSALTDSTPVYLQFTLDGEKAEIITNPVPDDFEGNIGVETEKVGSVEAHDESNPTDNWEEDWLKTWHTVINDLPRYDENGREYEYLLLEVNEDDAYFPIYETTRDSETGDYYTKVINPPPGEGQRIMVRKEWSDDSDSAHRGDVTINVYLKGDEESADTQLGTVILENGVWTEEVGINLPEGKTLDDVYILETSVDGEKVPLQPYTFGNGTPNYDTPKAPATTDVYQYQTKHHRYEATYSETTVSGEKIFIVNNRRLGNIDLTVTKTWNDGEGQLRDALAAANEKLGNAAIYPYIQLEFADGYDSEDRTINEISVNLGGSDTKIYDKEGNEASSLQKLSLELDGDTATEEVTFFNLPKYDESGSVASYTVKEVWLTNNSEDQTTSKAELKEYFKTNLQGYEKLNELLDLLDEFSTSVRQDSYKSNDEADAVNGEIPHDTQAMTVTNGLGNTKDVVWYKHWNDQYVFDQNQRPDIYIDVYRVVHDSPTTTKVELVKQDYLWEPRPADGEGIESDEIDQNSWKVTMSNVQKYDSYGYEIYYYATESTMVDYPSYDYVVGDYYKTNDLNFSEENYLGTADEIKTGGESYVLNFAEMKDKFDENIDPTKVLSPDYAANALKEGGMFVNSLDDQVAFQGQKIWQAEYMPNGYDDINLPAVTFELYRTTKPADEVKDEDGKLNYNEMEPFATQTVTDWASAHQNGTYVFTFMEKDADGNDTNKALKLPRYDAEGNVYTYYMREASADLGENGPALEDVFTVSDPESNTYVATNIYNPPTGEVYVQKHLELPDGMTESDVFPSIQFTLTRTYEGKTEGSTETTTIQDESFTQTITWKSDQVKAAWKAQQAEESGDEIVSSSDDDKLVFKDLEIYAPNGSKYIYTVTERIDEFLYGYTVKAGAGQLTADADTGYKSDFGEASPNVSGLVPVETAESEGSEPETQNGDDQSSTEKSWATFKNTFAQKEITLKGEKQWTDYNNAFGVRPDLDTLGEEKLNALFTVSRSADGQDAQGNPIGSQTLTAGTDYKIEWTESDNTWSFTITGPGDGDKLDAYAPNGMPWKYTVTEKTEELDDVVQEVYKANPGSITVSAGAEITDDNSELIFGSKLNNTMSAGVTFEKIWTDKQGQEIDEDYLDADLSVSFEAQVKPENGNWQNAAEYLKDVLGDTKYREVFGENEAFTKTLSGQISEASTWKSGKFDKLPAVVMTDDGVVHLQYRVVETRVEVDYPEGEDQTITVTYNGDGENGAYTISPNNGLVIGAALDVNGTKSTTTNTLDLDSLTFTKVWNDGNNQFGTRPAPDGENFTWTASFVVQRQEDGKWTTLKSRNDEDKVFALYGNDSDSNQSFTISGLPQGNYRVVELQPDYQRDASGVIDETYFVGVDGNDYHNGTYETEYTPALNDGAATAGDFEITNKLKTTGTSISVEKKWYPENVSTGASIQATLQYSNDSGTTWIALDTVTLNADKQWKHTWTSLPAKYPANVTTGTTQYQVVEGAVTGADEYMKLPVSSETNADKNVFYTITNVEKTNLTVEKKWAGVSVDQQKEIIVQLFSQIEGQTATPVEGKTLTLNSENNWKGTLRDLPAYNEDGAKYTYFAKETTTGDFVPSYVNGGDSDNGFTTTITNIGKVDINGTKTWVDNGDAYGTRPDINKLDGELELKLSRTTGDPADETVTWEPVDKQPTWTQSATDTNKWNYSYSDLPATDDKGQAYIYKVEEILPPDSEYEGQQEDYNFTNTLKQNISVSGTKTWVGGQPAELQLTLSRSTDGETWEEVKDAEGQLLQPTWANTDTDKWTYTYSDLPKYDENGVLYRYKVAETVPQDYDSAATSGEAVAVEDGDENVYTYDFTNVKKGALTVEKIVQGNRGETDRAFEFTVTLTGESTTGVKAEEINDKYGDMMFENGKATFTLKHGESITASGLPAGLTYSVEETDANADGYTTSNSGNTGTIPSGDTAKVYFTNTKHEGEALTTSVSVQKVWKIDNGGEQPESVKVQLEKDGQPYGNPVTLSDKNGWKHEWKDLPLGFTWTVEEVDAPEGFTSYTNHYDNHFVITNDDVDTEQKPETVNVRKVWVIDDGGERPDSVSVQLMRDGEPFGDPVTLSDANDWSHAWNDLESGHNWTVVELNVPDGFKATVSQSGDTFTIINDDTTEETTEIRANKEWTIDDGGTRADSVTVQLYCDGQPWGDPVTLSDSNDWTTLWEELPVGHSWSVVEINVPAGFTSSVTQEDGVITITNDDIPTDIPDPERPDPDPEDPDPDDPTDIPDPEKPDPDPDDPEPEEPDDPTDIPDPEKPDTDDPDDPTDIPDTEKPDDNKDPDNPTTPSNPSTPSSPSTPSHSTTPGTSGTTTTTTTDKSDDKDAPQTGDNTHTRALFALCLASLAGMTVIGVSRKRQRKDDSDQS